MDKLIFPIMIAADGLLKTNASKDRHQADDEFNVCAIDLLSQRIKTKLMESYAFKNGNRLLRYSSTKFKHNSYEKDDD